jgi:hypothetical protein
MGVGKIWDAATFGPRRRRRWMKRRLAQLDRQSAMASPDGRVRRAASGNGGRRYGPAVVRRHPAATVTIAVILGITAGSWFYAAGSGGGTANAGAPGMPRISPSRSIPADEQAPPAGVQESKHRLHPAVAAPAGQGGYRFMASMPSGVPVSYDPCRPIHYVIRDHDTPGGGDQMIRTAISQLGALTGLTFVDDGTSAETPADDRAAYQPARYGKKWAPILIAWTDPQETPDLAGATIGRGGSDVRGILHGGVEDRRYVTGTVVLDAPQLAQAINAGQPEVASAVISHELGHLVGLAHVNDATQLMYPETQLKVDTFGSGDRRGLARLGSGTCEPNL